ncbi:hypothetical protein FB45DRAFT_917483 [Roridomyces roridus]|uniref:NUDE domain-containing protein n=1 Tax=Roridomyces roridus TaxID=1738132 RepID=A0AAD7FP08_9AGAR|nr:hypothetical protein FB45DRAFT_917483 [Roridomyces roridus]
MTAVLSPLRGLMDDNQLSYSSANDWREKYNEVADMLTETRAELDEFHVASRELEAELEAELKGPRNRNRSSRSRSSSKFMSLQTNHNTTTTTLQRELDRLRQEHQQTKVQLRELEMGNDDLERNERAVSSSLADIESKYSRALEEKILLEHELLDKANLEEESQRLKDELRDANVEISILKDQLAAQSATDNASIAPSSHFPQLTTQQSEDDLLNTAPPPDLQLEDLTPSSDSLPSVDTTPRGKAQSALVNRSGAGPFKSNIATPSGSSGIARSTTIPHYGMSPRSPHRPPAARNVSTMSTSTTSSTTSRSKGVQMVSEMRARVRNLEQKIHTRVPRLRMGSLTGKPNANGLAASTMTNGSNSVKPPAKGDSAGWVLIMEDSPSPPKAKPGERRRASSPLGMIAFKPAASTSAATPPAPPKPNPLNQSTYPASGLRRPQSRLSGGSTTTSIPSSASSSSRPETPTFLPIPTGGLYAHSSTAGASGLKRSTVPSAPNPYSKRSSLGTSTGKPPPPEPRERPTTMPPLPRNSGVGKVLPQLPASHANVTVRAPRSLPVSVLSQSRIGRPNSTGGRKSAGDTEGEIRRPRSGSTAR